MSADPTPPEASAMDLDALERSIAAQSQMVGDGDPMYIGIGMAKDLVTQHRAARAELAALRRSLAETEAAFVAVLYCLSDINDTTEEKALENARRTFAEFGAPKWTEAALAALRKEGKG